jgi:hypothetical protein
MSEEDPGPLHLRFLKPHKEQWRELMLDLGAPLDAPWEIWVAVHAHRIRDDMPYNVSEMVSIQDLRGWESGERLGETEVSDSDLELFNPIYVMRTRLFLFDERPLRDNVPPISPTFPDGPFIEIKTNRIAPPSPDVHSTISFQIGSVPAGKQADELLRLLRWWRVYAVTRRVNERGELPLDQIQLWTEMAIEKMAQASNEAGKIFRYSFTRFNDAFPYNMSRQHLYKFIPEDERKELKARYLKKCAELMG